MFSVYTKHLIGSTGENLAVLEGLKAAIWTVDGPWIIAADWNMSPETLAATGWLSMVNGQTVSTTLSTCTNSVYDYFVVAQSIRHAIKGIQRIKDAGLQPHYPVRLLLEGNARRIAVRKLVKAPKVFWVLPKGSPCEPRDYAAVSAAAKAKRITDAVTQWYTLARQEWSDIANADLQHKEAKFI